MSDQAGGSGDKGGGKPPPHPGGGFKDHKKPDQKGKFFGGPLMSKGGGGPHKKFDKPQSVSSGTFWLGTSIVSLLLIVIMVMVYGMTQDLREARDGITNIDVQNQKISRDVKDVKDSSGKIQDLIVETGNSIKKRIERISVLPRKSPSTAQTKKSNKGKKVNLAKFVDKRVDDRLDQVIGERVARIRADLERLRQESRKRKVVIQLVKERDSE